MSTKKCVLGSEEGEIRLARARLNWPALIKPKMNKAKKKEEYSVGFLLPPAADLTYLRKQMTEYALSKAPNEKTAKRWVDAKLLDPTDMPSGKSMGDEWDGWTLIRCTGSQYPIATFDHRVRPVTDEAEIYGGRWAFGTIALGHYERADGSGLMVFARSVQLLEHDDRIGGGAVDGSKHYSEYDLGEDDEDEDDEAFA